MRLFTWDEAGARIHCDCSYTPYIYLETLNEQFDATSIFNTKLRKLSFRSQSERYKYVSDNSVTRIFENLSPPQQFLVDTFYSKNDTPEFSKHPLKVQLIDIETYSVDGFPDVKNPDHPVNVITIYDSLDQQFYTWGLKALANPQPGVTYVHCLNEVELFQKVISFIQLNTPDILSGWNCEQFDIPYILARGNRLVGNEAMLRLSPSGKIYSRTAHNKFGKDFERWYIDGISCVDYLEIYRKFCTTLRESYKLNAIGELELGESKVDYGDQNLSSLADNNWDLFVQYNVQDVNLLVKLEKKLRYVELLRMLAYAGCTTFEGALGTVSVVTGMCAIKARTKKLRIPTFNRPVDDGSKNEGAYVGEPQQGFQEHIVSFDANSLYPNVMITLNLSPETKVAKIIEKDKDHTTIQHVNGKIYKLTKEQFKKFLEIEKLSISMAGVLCSQKQRGIVPEIVDGFYQKRVEIQKKLKKLQKRVHEFQGDTSTAEYKKVKYEIDYLDIKQFTIKIAINSVYGYFGNKKSPLGDDDIARSITLTGQAVIKQSNTLLREYATKNSAVDINSYDPIIYNDTDSCYVSISKIAQAKGVVMHNGDLKVTPAYLELVKDIENHLNTGIKVWGASELNSHDCRFVFKREVIADTGLFLQKKRYVIRVLDKEGIPSVKFKYTGVEVVRTTMPSALKPYVKRIIETMLTTKSKSETDKIFNETYSIFKTLPLEDIAFVMGINGYEKYAAQCNEYTPAKHMPIHVKAAYYHNKLLAKYGITAKYEQMGTGDKIRYFYVKQPNKLGINVLGYKYYLPAEFKADFAPDYEKMFEKIIYSVIDRFYNAVKWQVKSPAMIAQTDLFDLLGV